MDDDDSDQFQSADEGLDSDLEIKNAHPILEVQGYMPEVQLSSINELHERGIKLVTQHDTARTDTAQSIQPLSNETPDDIFHNNSRRDKGMELSNANSSEPIDPANFPENESSLPPEVNLDICGVTDEPLVDKTQLVQIEPSQSSPPTDYSQIKSSKKKGQRKKNHTELAEPHPASPHSSTMPRNREPEQLDPIRNDTTTDHFTEKLAPTEQQEDADAGEFTDHVAPTVANQKRSPPPPDHSQIKSSKKKGQRKKNHTELAEPHPASPHSSTMPRNREPEQLDPIGSDTTTDHFTEKLAPTEQQEDADAGEFTDHVTPTVANQWESAPHKANLSDQSLVPDTGKCEVQEGNDNLWNSELLSSTASTLVRGVGDGLSSLAGAFAQVVKFGSNEDETDPELLERRQQRAREEKAEREALSEAWSNVWNTTWGTNDGWDVEDIDIPDSKPNTSKTCTELSGKMEETKSSSKPSFSDQTRESTKSESTALWDWSAVSSLAQQITSSFHTTSLSLVQEGVNVLEKIGKKTMSVIEENDPGFQYTKNLLRPPGLQERPNLSQIIREAHERHQAEKNNQTTTKEFNRGSFTAQLELNRALIHLEALELVSDKAESQLHIQLDSLSTTDPYQEELTLHGGILEAIWRILQLDVIDDEDEFPDQTTWKVLKCKKQQKPGFYGSHPADLSEQNTPVWVAFERSLWLIKNIYPGERLLENITKVWDDMKKLDKSTSSQELFYTAIGALAEVCSAQLGYLHKLAECTLVRAHKPTADFERLTSIVTIMFRAIMKLTDVLCSEYTHLIKSAHKANETIKPAKSASQLVGSLLLECGNAQNYLKNAAHLLVPVFQLACVNTKGTVSEAE